MNNECPILVTRAQHRPPFSGRRCSASSLPLTHVGVVIFRHNLAYEMPLLGNVVWRDAHRCWKWLSRFGVAASCDHRSRHQCVAEQPSCAPTFTAMYCCSSLLFGGTRAVVAQCRPVEAHGALPTIDVTARARWRRLRMRQRCIRCATTRCCRMAGRAQMSDNVDSFWRATQCRPSTSPPVHGGTAVVCARVTYDVPVLAVVVWRDERRCRSMSTRRGALCSVDHRPRCSCTVAPPPIAPRLPTMYQYSLWWNSEPRADVGQCRPVDARGAVSTIDVAALARWRRRHLRQACLRCTSTRCGHSAGRAQMSHNVDSSRRAADYRPSTSLPVHDGAAVVCAKVAHDVPVLAVIVWWDARRCWSMPTRRGARRSVD
jgi:hypothetical protein